MANENIKGKDEGVKETKEQILQNNILGVLNVPTGETPFDTFRNMYMVLDPQPAMRLVLAAMEEYKNQASVDREEGWIACEKDLPDGSHEVMVYAPDCDIIGHVLIGCYFNDTKTWTVYDFGDSKLDEKVTHWKPLPSPPINNKS